MDQQIFQTLVVIAGLLMGALGFCIAWWVNNLWAMVRSQQVQITELNVELARNYMPRIETDRNFVRIFEKLDEILKTEKRS